MVLMSFRYKYMFLAIISLVLTLHFSGAALGMVAGQPHINVSIGGYHSVNIILLNTGSIPVSFKVVLPIFKSKNNNTIPNITVSPMIATIAPKTDLVVNVTAYVSKKNNTIGNSWVGILQFIEVSNITNIGGAVINSGLAKIVTVTVVAPTHKSFSLLHRLKNAIFDITKIAKVTILAAISTSSMLIIYYVNGLNSNLIKIFTITTRNQISSYNIIFITGLLMIVIAILVVISIIYINRRRKRRILKEDEKKRKIEKMRTKRKKVNIKPSKRRKKASVPKKTVKQSKTLKNKRIMIPKRSKNAVKTKTPSRKTVNHKRKGTTKPFNGNISKKNTSIRKGRKNRGKH